MGGFVHSGPAYNLEKLREVYGKQRATDDDNEDTPDPNYKCQSCGNRQYVDDHTRHAPSYCKSCDSVKTFARLNK